MSVRSRIINRFDEDVNYDMVWCQSYICIKGFIWSILELSI